MKQLSVEIADTPHALAQGLMGRTELPENTGMLFQFPSSLEASFWGKNTYIPLDIAFVDKNNTIIDIKSITPLSTKAIRSAGFCDKAIETNAGFFNKHNIKAGDTIKIDSDGGSKLLVIFQ